MEHVAIISDLHGNLPALEAVLCDIKRRNISRIFCLGDLVGKGPHAEKVVDICQDVCEVTIKGNWDDHISKPPRIRRSAGINNASVLSGSTICASSRRRSSSG